MPEKGVGMKPATLEVKTTHPFFFELTNFETKWCEILTAAVVLPFVRLFGRRAVEQKENECEGKFTRNKDEGTIIKNSTVHSTYIIYVHSTFAKSFPSGA